MNNSAVLESTNQIINYLKEKKIAHMNVDGNGIYGNILEINGQDLINFGSCSYLGLEYDARMKSGAGESLNIYGTQFSASRAYVSAGMYQELELKLSQIFGGHVLVTPTTTLGHISTIPVLIGRDDCVIMDHQVHQSVQTAVKLVKAEGTHVELVRHNRMDLLEARLNELKKKYANIWYMADGIYSMYGDRAPMKELESLLIKHEQFHLYVDDAHAMSCFGQNGRGYALSEIDLHPRMVMGTSLNKAFASGGGAFIFPSKEMYDKVRNCGGPMITSGPMQPAALGAAIAAADIHLSDEIYELQKELNDNVSYCHHLLQEYGLPNLAEKDSPIFFVGVGAPKPAYEIIEKLIKDGFLVNIGIFPAVPMKNTGLRFTITRLHTFGQIEDLVSSLADYYFEALTFHETSVNEVCQAFKINPPREFEIEKKDNEASDKANIKVEIFQTIMDVKKEEWNELLGENSSFDWTALNILENSFSGNSKKEHNWNFEYLIIRDSNGVPILATFFSSGLLKDDMLLDKSISQEVEQTREYEPYHKTSLFLSIGCLITEGNHLFLNEGHQFLDEAIRKFFSVVEDLQIKYHASQTILRDFPSDDVKMDDLMVDNGYFKLNMPDNFKLNISNWNLEESYTSLLSKKSRKHFRNNVERNLHEFQTKIQQKVSLLELNHYFDLYQNVQRKNMDINTFELPFEMFESMNKNENWEFIELNLDSAYGYGKPVSVVFAYKGLACYAPTMMGIDYSVASDLNTYRQSIYQAIRAAKLGGYDEVRLGFSAGVEKKKFAAKAFKTVAYMQSSDHFSMEALLTDSVKNTQPKEATIERTADSMV
jgi:7-keto-8-aminopelargonate synthetase-like enzyme/predicted N-acyltransferase